ncbi:MAG: hypothetical protein EAX96_01430 [Candidatus Lokiarchaeota archaeon]|nr:hypothetical protein [Candidatus Lokiarchaeota archaeon]
MPCFFMRAKVKRVLDSLKIKNKERLNQLLLDRYTDEELHQMSDEDLIILIRELYDENKEELTEEVLMMYA